MNRTLRIKVTAAGHILGRTRNTCGITGNGKIKFFCFPISNLYKYSDADVILSTGLFEIIVRVLTTCHTQYTSDSSICGFLFNRTTLQVFVTYLTGALYVHRL